MGRAAALALFAMIATKHAYAGSFFPDAEDVRTQKIERQAGESDWPFVEQRGLLMCVRVFGIKHVLFYPGEPDRYEFGGNLMTDPELAHVTTDPIQLWTDPVAAKLLVPGMSIEEKIRRMAPYVTFGKKLCDQPKGSTLGPGEL
jgi:hypothetical protein